MTEFILVRHAQPDYSVIENTNFIIMNGNLANLSKEGIEQAKQLATNLIFSGADMLLSSPYTRAMETASYISLATQLPITVEFNLHEWIPDINSLTKDNQEKIVERYKQAVADYKQQTFPQDRLYEPLIETRQRALNVLEKYMCYSKVIVVAHSGVLYSLTGKRFNKAQCISWYMNKDIY